MAEVTRVTSEALQATVRRLLPSQQGFGEDLQASNVIIPVIDLTPTAEGSILPTNLQTALAFGSQTAFDIQNTTTVVANTAGFHRIIGVANVGSLGETLSFSMSDGLSTKTVWKTESFNYGSGNIEATTQVSFDFTVFLDSGDSISGIAGSVGSLTGSVRQIADVNGNLTNPSGFVSQ